MKKLRTTVIIAVVIVVIVTAITSSGFFNPQTSNQPTPTPLPTIKPITDVQITNFHFTNFFPAEGLSWHAGFILEVTNNEILRIDELTLTFTSGSPYNMNRTIGFYNNTSLSNQRYFEMDQPCFLGSLEQGETKLLYGYIANNFDDSYKIRGYVFDVTLRIGDTVLDQASTEIP